MSTKALVLGEVCGDSEDSWINDNYFLVIPKPIYSQVLVKGVSITYTLQWTYVPTLGTTVNNNTPTSVYYN